MFVRCALNSPTNNDGRKIRLLRNLDGLTGEFIEYDSERVQVDSIRVGSLEAKRAVELRYISIGWRVEDVGDNLYVIAVINAEPYQKLLIN